MKIKLKLYFNQCRQDKVNVLPVTRTATGKLPPTKQLDIVTNNGQGTTIIKSNVILSGKATSEEIKEKMEQQLRLQRAAHHQKRANEMKQQTG